MKYRHPDSFEFALVAIAKAIGWQRVAEIARKTDRTVRDWSDPDSPRTPPIATAAELDRAWAHAGRPGSPMLDALTRQIGPATIVITYDPARLGNATLDCIREGGEAKQALVEVMMAGSCPATRRNAAIQVAEGIAAYEATLPLLAIPVACPP